MSRVVRHILPRPLRQVLSRFSSAYRPERHYMRGGNTPGARSATPQGTSRAG